jgi:hypothetical protein
MAGSTKQRMCLRKVRYNTWLAAHTALGNNRLLHVYPCPFCNGFHLGHLSLRHIDQQLGPEWDQPPIT